MGDIPWELLNLVIGPMVGGFIGRRIESFIEKLKDKKVLKEEFEKRVMPQIQKIVDITKDMKEAYVKLAEGEYNCETFKNKIVEGNKQVMQVTFKIMDITLDIYSKHLEEFKNVAKPETIAILDDMDYKMREEEFDIVEMINAYLSDEKNASQMRKDTKKIMPQLFDERFWDAYNKLMSEESKRNCVNEAGVAVMELFSINDRFMKNAVKILGR